MQNRTHDGKVFRMLCVIDEYTRECLFDDDQVLPLTEDDIQEVIDASHFDWSQIEPAVFGTLFERGLDPGKRTQLGAHFTNGEKIQQIIQPVVIEPLLSEWAQCLQNIKKILERTKNKDHVEPPKGQRRARGLKAWRSARELKDQFLERLKNFRILDPACGSGNFLHIALWELKTIEHRVHLDCEAIGLHRDLPVVGPENMLGIEKNPYAAELARVSVWMSEIQWMRRHGFLVKLDPVLRSLDTIECRDALLNEDGSETDWPSADVIVGNPPFLGAKLMKKYLGKDETERIRSAFSGRLPGFTDLVCYWFEKAREQITDGHSSMAGFVATNSIAKNTNLPVLRKICEDLMIFEAFPDEPWVINGAAVRVALIGFSHKENMNCKIRLNGSLVGNINPDLSTGIDTTSLGKLNENDGVGFVGIQKSGPFDVPEEIARTWLSLPNNPNGQSNSEIIRPTSNGSDMVSNRRNIWLIDFPRGLSEAEAALWEAPFQYLYNAKYDPDDDASPLLRDYRKNARDEHPRKEWWTNYWPRPDVRKAIEKLDRFIATPMTSEHRIFSWFRLPTIPDNNTIIIARDDDTSFGIVHSSIHEIWSTKVGNRMGAGNQRRYNPATVFNSFPFPEGLTPDVAASNYQTCVKAKNIAQAAMRLNELRENWLNPPDLTIRTPEVVPGYPDRISPIDGKAAEILRTRTLTNLYNDRPEWLDHIHRKLNRAVAAAYGWEADFDNNSLTLSEILNRLFELNQTRQREYGS